MKSNLSPDGTWNIDALLRRPCTNVAQFAQLVRNAQKKNPPGGLWHEWASLDDWFGEMHEIESDENVPDSLKAMAYTTSQRAVLSLVCPPKKLAFERQPVRMGPTTRAKEACMFPPVTEEIDGTTLVGWTNYAQMCVVYESEPAATFLYERDVQRKKEFGGKRQRTDVHGGTSQQIFVTLSDHFDAVQPALMKMWQKNRLLAYKALEEQDDYLRHGYHILKRNRHNNIVYGVLRNFVVNPIGEEEEFLCKVFALKRLVLDTMLLQQTNVDERVFPLCVKPGRGNEDQHKFDGRKFIKCVESDLRNHKTEPNLAAADALISIMKQYYDLMGWIERSKAIVAPVKEYTSPACASCPLGYSSPDNCLMGTNHDQTKAMRVADVIRANLATLRLEKQRGAIEIEAESDNDDDIFANLEMPT